MDLINPTFQQIGHWIRHAPLFGWCETFIARHANSRGKRVSIAAAIALFTLGRAFLEVFRPPKELRHIPHVSYMQFIKGYMQRMSTEQIFNAYIKPIQDKSGIYIRPQAQYWVVHITNPQDAKTFFLKTDLCPKKELVRTPGTLRYHFVNDENILHSNGAVWKKHRRIVAPAFQRASPARTFGEVAVSMFETNEQKFPDQNTFEVDMYHMMGRVAFESLGRAGFGFNFNATTEDICTWKQEHEQSLRDLGSPLYYFFPFIDVYLRPLFPERVAAHERVDRFRLMLAGLIAEKRQNVKHNLNAGVEEHEKDLLTLMLEAELRGEGILTSEELLNNIVVFFFAGHNSTASALSAAIYWLARYPEVQQRARDEVNGILVPEGEEEPRIDLFPTLEQARQFAYITQIIKETMRISTPIIYMSVPRILTSDVEMSGYLIPKDTLINVNFYDLHHNEKVWSKPHEFNADRWAPDGEADQNSRAGYAWTPFGNGPRQCIGINFSLNQQRVILAMMLRRYEFSLPEDSIHKDGLKSGNANLMQFIDLRIRVRKRF